MRIDVVGSKPNPTFPAGEPDVVFLVNGAIGYAPRYSDQTYKIGFASLNFCSPFRNEKTKPDRDAVAGCALDKLYHWSPKNEDLLKHVNFTYEEEEELDTKTLRRLSYKYLPLSYLASHCIQNFERLKELRKFCLGRQPYLTCSRPSSGMLAVEFAHETYKCIETLNVIGISVFDFSEHYYDTKHKSDNFHAEGDQFVYNKLTRVMGERINFLDLARST